MEGVSGRAEATQQDTEMACRGLSVTQPAAHPAPPAPMGPARALSTAGVQEKEKEKPHLGARTHDQEAASLEKMGSNGKKRAIGEERPPGPRHSLRSSEGRPPEQERPPAQPAVPRGRAIGQERVGVAGGELCSRVSVSAAVSHCSIANKADEDTN